MSVTGVGQPCPTCGRPIEAVGVEHCPSCAAAKCDLGERKRRRRWKRKRPEGVGTPGEGWHSTRAEAERVAREIAERDEERVEE